MFHHLPGCDVCRNTRGWFVISQEPLQLFLLTYPHLPCFELDTEGLKGKLIQQAAIPLLGSSIAWQTNNLALLPIP